jgi:hypothetical protein
MPLNCRNRHRRQRFIESQDIPETENTLGLDGREAKFYMYIQSTTMERPDLERTMEQVLPYGKSITGKQHKLFKLVLVTYM